MLASRQRASLGLAHQRNQASSLRGKSRSIAGWLLLVICAIALGFYHWRIYVPQPDRPHMLAAFDRLFDIGVAVAIVYAGLLFGLQCMSWLRVYSMFAWPDRLALGTGLGLGGMSLGVLALGMMHLYYPATFVALLLAAPWCFPRQRRLLGHDVRRFPLALRKSLALREASLFDVVARVVLAGLSLVSLVLTFARDLTMPSLWTGYDTYQYHWAVPMLWLQSHGVRAMPGWAHANLPFNSEMLNLVALALSAPEAANLVQDVFLLLCAVLVYGMVRRHFGVTAAWLATATLVSVPLLVVYSSQSMVETALLFYGVAAMVVMIEWLLHLIRAGQMDYRRLVLAGILTGFDIGVKYTAIELVPGLVLMLVTGLGMLTWRRSAARSLGQSAKLTAQALSAFGFPAVVVFAPWLLKNWVLLGNPVYPALASVFGAPLWNGARDRTLIATFASFGPHAGLVTTLYLFAVDVFFHPWRYGEGIGYPAGFVAFACVLSIFFAWFSARRGWFRKSSKEQDKVLVTSALGVVLLLGFGAWTVSGALVERYALPVIVLTNVLGAVLLAWAIERMPRRLVLVSWLLLGITVATLSFQVWGSLWNDGYTDSPWRNPLPLLTGQVSEQASLRDRGPYGMPQDFWEMTDYVNSYLPHNGRLLMLGRGSGYFFTNRDYVADSGGDWVPYLVSAGQTPDGILRILRSQHFTYVVYDAKLMQWLTVEYKNDVLASYLPTYRRFQETYLTPIASWGDLALYSVPSQLSANRTASSAVGPTQPTTDKGRRRLLE